MAEPMQPRLKTNKDGSRTLYVFYTGTGWDKVIEAAEKHFGIEGDPTVSVICYPMSSKLNDNKGGGWCRRFIGRAPGDTPAGRPPLGW